MKNIEQILNFIVEVEKLLGVYSKPDNDIVFNYKCKVVGGKLQLTSEAKQHKYYKLANIPENTIKKQVERIKDYYNETSLVMKVQTGSSSLKNIKSNS